MPTQPRIKEACLYVADLARAVRFYTDLFGYTVMVSDDRFAALSVAGQDVLLLFLQGGTVEPAVLPNGGVIPPHDGSGQNHLGLAISMGEIAEWESRLVERGIAIESRVTWERGGVSLYFRDPDGHLLELLTPGIWPIY
jgi:catechol 2,3-dioxygenase-like lactoylglutathione lyase family enzyme